MTLNQKVAVYVPSKVGTTKVLAMHRRWVKRVMTRMAGLFGGATYTKGIGSWVDASGRLITETVGIVSSYTDKAGIQKGETSVLNLALEMATAMEQECVAVEMNGGLSFVSGESMVPAAVAG